MFYCGPFATCWWAFYFFYLWKTSSQDVNWWTGVVWILWIIIIVIIQLFGLSFWRHPFTVPLVSKSCSTTFIEICSNEETISSTSCIAWIWVHFHEMFIFGVNYSFNTNIAHNPNMLKQSSFLWSTFIFFTCRELQGWNKCMDLKGKVIKLARYLLYMYINGRRGKVRLGNLCTNNHYFAIPSRDDTLQH